MKRLIGGGGGGSGTPGGSDTQVQFNDGGAFGGDVDLTWNKTTNVLSVTGDVNLSDGGSFTTTLQTITPTANRTVSLPNATGTVALVAGSSGQITYNNAGANAGVSSFTADSSGRLTNSASSAASLPVKLWNGTIFAGTTPHVLVQPSTASAGSWSASGTALGVNTAAAFGGNLLDLQVNGSSLFRAKSNGVFEANGVYAASSFYITGKSGFVSPTDGILRIGNNNDNDFNRLQFGGSTSSFPALKRNSAVLETKLADDSAYARHAASVFQAATAHTVATLPATPAVGMIARVTDATAPAVGSTVVGGGAAAALVWYNGANWSVIGV